MRFVPDDLENLGGLHKPRKASALGEGDRRHFAPVRAFEAFWDFIREKPLLMPCIGS
jgi:hypothetical protein